MTTLISIDMTLGEIVTRHPVVADDLDRRGLDFCCGGAQTLDDACRAHGLDSSHVAAELAERAVAQADTPAAWATMGVVQLVDHLEATHHGYLHQELPHLSTLVEKIRSVHGSRHPELAEVQVAFEELRADLEPHLRKEEQVLFPAIRALATASATEPPAFPFGTIENPISVMLREHDRAGELLERLRMLTGDYEIPADGCASYRLTYEGLARLEADTHLHVHKENNLLFPAVRRLESRLAGTSA